jgi:2-amino-4-hydroxy-6-hydroxymethyldihydropteridine diphosphokinase
VTKQDSSENQAKLVYLAIGSNLGNKIQNIDKAKLELKTHNVKILKCSNNFESESWPDPSKPDFINIVIKAEVYCGALKLLEICKLVEKKLGRVKSKKNSPRN